MAPGPRQSTPIPEPIKIAAAPIETPPEPPPETVEPRDSLVPEQTPEPVAKPTPPHPLVVDWTSERGFPYEYGVARQAWEEGLTDEDENRLRKRKHIEQLAGRIDQVVAAARQTNRRVSALVFVIAASAEGVEVLADVTAGCFTTPSGEYDRDLPQAGLVWLQTSGQLTPTLRLPASAKFDAETSACLHWGDRIVVEFDVAGIDARPPQRAEKLELGKPLVTVAVQGLRVIEAKPREGVSDFWGGRRSPPVVLGAGQGISPYVSELMALVLNRVTAQMRVKEVVGGKIVLYRDLSEYQVPPTVLLKRREAERFIVPVRLVGDEQVAKFTDNTRVLMSFSVESIRYGWWRVNDTTYGDTSLNKYALGVQVEDVVYTGLLTTSNGN